MARAREEVVEGFFDLNEISQESWMMNAWRASVATHFAEEDGNSSGIFISPTGYFLTALHTIRWLLKDFGILHDETVSKYELLKTVVTNQSPSSLYLDCMKIKEYDLRRPQVIFLGKGLHVLRGIGIQELPQEKIAEAASGHHDFAILKFETEQHLPFVPLSSVELNNQEDVFHISTPLPAPRANSRSSVGNTKYITLGKTGDLINSECLAESDEVRTKTKLFYDPAHHFCSADHSIGSSGGPFFNKMGELIGISTIGLYASNKEYKSLGTGFLKASHILKQLPSGVKDQ